MGPIEEISLVIREMWIGQGLFDGFYSAERIISAAGRFGSLPVEYMSFVETAGMQRDSDSSGFRFWHLDEVRLDSPNFDGDADPKCNLIIADYLQESWWYGISFSSSAQITAIPITGRVETPKHDPISFLEFLRRYAYDSELLMPSNWNTHDSMASGSH